MREFLGLTSLPPSPQMASQLVQPFLHSSATCPTEAGYEGCVFEAADDNAGIHDQDCDERGLGICTAAASEQDANLTNVIISPPKRKLHLMWDLNNAFLRLM